ncbi:hypothetical protein H5410_056716 [Solanum commersonii]|uniref:Uncharacterized protein n=1 Tax=Solanum commersonii TaxID=4109 RepID=A0A9J5WNW5_SOLCO|nr:hypothetical protein H5410_056716 [Solanum commersonii]
MNSHESTRTFKKKQKRKKIRHLLNEDRYHSWQIRNDGAACRGATFRGAACRGVACRRAAFRGSNVSTKNKRGRTQMHNVHARKEHKLILLNRENQPVGPTDDVIYLSSFLGTLARNATLCPFDIFDWRSMDTK